MLQDLLLVTNYAVVAAVPQGRMRNNVCETLKWRHVGKMLAFICTCAPCQASSWNTKLAMLRTSHKHRNTRNRLQQYSKLSQSWPCGVQPRTRSKLMDALPVEILLSPGEVKQFRLVKKAWHKISFPRFMHSLVVDDVAERLSAFKAFLPIAGLIWTESITILPSSSCNSGLTGTVLQSDGFLFLRQLSRLEKLTVRTGNSNSSLTAQYPLDLILSIKAPKEVLIHAPLNMKRMKEMMCPFVSALTFDSDYTPSAKHLTSFIIVAF